jgi:hypothetical protein
MKATKKTQNCECNTKSESENDDFASIPNPEEVRARLLEYECELSNMSEYLKEQFDGSLPEKAVRRLEQAEKEMKKLDKLASQ